MRVHAMLSIMLKGERTPHGLELLNVKIVIKLHLMQFFNHNLILIMSERTEHPIVTFLLTPHSRTVLCLKILWKFKLIPYTSLSGTTAELCYAHYRIIYHKKGPDKAHKKRSFFSCRFRCGSKCIIWGCAACPYKDKGKFWKTLDQARTTFGVSEIMG